MKNTKFRRGKYQTDVYINSSSLNFISRACSKVILNFFHLLLDEIGEKLNVKFEKENRPNALIASQELVYRKKKIDKYCPSGHFLLSGTLRMSTNKRLNEWNNSFARA